MLQEHEYEGIALQGFCSPRNFDLLSFSWQPGARQFFLVHHEQLGSFPLALVHSTSGPFLATLDTKKEQHVNSSTHLTSPSSHRLLRLTIPLPLRLFVEMVHSFQSSSS